MISETLMLYDKVGSSTVVTEEGSLFLSFPLFTPTESNLHLITWGYSFVELFVFVLSTVTETLFITLGFVLTNICNQLIDNVNSSMPFNKVREIM